MVISNLLGGAWAPIGLPGRHRSPRLLNHLHVLLGGIGVPVGLPGHYRGSRLLGSFRGCWQGLTIPPFGMESGGARVPAGLPGHHRGFFLLIVPVLLKDSHGLHDSLKEVSLRIQQM